MRREGHVALMKEKRNAYSVCVGKSEQKRPLERPSCGWEKNIKVVYNGLILGRKLWSGLMCHRIGKSERLVRAQQ
jgi:hypothetical protein